MALVADSEFRKRLERLELVARSRGLIGTHGHRQGAVSHGTGMEFHGHRHYMPGDDLRLLDWNALGRLDQLVLKQFETPSALNLVLAIDCSPTMDFGDPGKLEYARYLAAAIGWVALRNNEAVYLAELGDELHREGAAISDEATLFSRLDQLKPRSESPDLEAWLRRVKSPQGGQFIVLLSDFLDRERMLPALGRMRSGQSEVLAINLAAPQELRPDFSGLMRLRLRSAEGEQLQRLNVGAHTIERYQEEVRRYRNAIAAACRKTGAACVNLMTTTALEDVIMDLLALRLLRIVR